MVHSVGFIGAVSPFMLYFTDDLRGDSINQLSPGSGGTGTGETRLSLALGTKSIYIFGSSRVSLTQISIGDNHLLASLKIIASLAQYQPGELSQYTFIPFFHPSDRPLRTVEA